MREYITPNWHVVLVHAPLGLLSVGIFIEFFSFLWRRSSARAAGRWMILLGALTAVPALTSGIYAYRDALDPKTNVNDVAFQDKWSDIMDAKLIDRAGAVAGEKVKEITVDEFVHNSEGGAALWHHLLYNCIGVGVLFLAIIGFIGCSDRWRKNLYIPLLLILLAGEGLLIWGSHAGGLAVYEHAAAIKPPTKPSSQKPTVEEQLKAVVPPAQLHLTLAGWVVGVAMIALALSIRAITEGSPTPTTDEAWYEGQQAKENGDSAIPATSTALVGDGLGTSAAPQTLSLAERPPEITRTVTTSVTTSVEPLVPVATSRYWLLVTLFSVATAVTGLWMINAWNWPYLQNTLRGENRNMYHSILGTSIIVLTLVLALVTRLARRNKVMISIFSLLLFVVVGLQVYVGIMLTFDGPKGIAPKGTTANLITPFRLNVSKD